MLKNLGQKLKALLGLKTPTADLFEELEDVLIEADVGAGGAVKLVDALRALSREQKIRSSEDLKAALAQQIRSSLSSVLLEPVSGRQNVFLMLGVNGVGKTTTIAKMASFYLRTGWKEGIVMAAGDTFRAGAIDQIHEWGRRLGVRVVSQQAGADPGAVIFDAIESASARGEKLVLADSAGRLHTKENLLRELEKIDKIVGSRAKDGNYKKILVLDATTGQNGMRQAEVFHQSVKLDAVVLSKFDSTAKGGMIISVCRDLGIPIAFVGHGEKASDLSPFDPDQWVKELVGA